MAIGSRAQIFTEINVTPLTDVFLVLLVIMILLAPLVNTTVLKVEPPSFVRLPELPPDGHKIDVNVLANGRIDLNNIAVNPPDTAGVTAAIKVEQQKAGRTDIPLNLQSDPDARQKYVVTVMDAAAGCGIKQLHVLPLKN